LTSDDFKVDGNHVPKEMGVGCSLYAFHHNEDIFPDSYKFDPERWIVSKSNPAKKVAALRKYFSPFSLATIVCLGMNFALTDLADSIAVAV
jgi:cytochrome P450